MAPGRRPPAEVDLDAALVRRLLAGQFPEWVTLELRRVKSPGWDNEIFRLGDHLAVRLPRRTMGAHQVAKQHRWLASLAGQLPLPIPVPVGAGEPAEGYPWPWSVVPWFVGAMAAVAPPVDRDGAGRSIADFLAALQAIDGRDGPTNEFRGVPLARRDEHVRTAIARLDGLMANTASVLRVWTDGLRMADWRTPPTWFHGDLHPANVVVTGGRVSAIIDFGHLGVGDPACDMLIAWTMLSSDERSTFRQLLGVDEATWLRGRGWAVAVGAAAVAYSGPDEILARIGRRALTEVMADAGEPVSWVDKGGAESG